MSLTLTIILPTYNEAENISVLLRQILSLSLPLETKIIVIDDNSPDRTAELVKKEFSSFPQIKLIKRQGKVRGLVNSLNEAIENASSDYILWMDADLQMPAVTICDFAEKIVSETPLAVIGSRFLAGGEDVRDTNAETLVPSLHKSMSHILSSFIPRILGLSCSDITSGFIAVKRDFLRGNPLKGKHGEYFIELVYDLSKNGGKIIEIPYQLLPRSKGESKSTGGTFLGIFITGILYLKTALRLSLKG